MISAGARLGPYEVISPLGAGGMGEVWKARDPRLGREVAIKVLPASFSADGESLYIARSGELPLRIYRIRLATGKQDRAGLIGIDSVAVTRDGKSYAYSCNRVTASDLFLVTGWK